MNHVLFFLLLLISATTFGQEKILHYDSLTRTAKSFFDNGQVHSEIIQLGKVQDKHRHVIYYLENGQKAQEFFDKDHVRCDTLKTWFQGRLSMIRVYSDTGCTEIFYYEETGKILETGHYKIDNAPSMGIILYDSTLFLKHIPEKCDTNEPCYMRTEIWKTYHENGILESEGQYLPMPYETTTIALNVDHATGVGYLKDGVWKYYDEKGRKTKEEFYKDSKRIK